MKYNLHIYVAILMNIASSSVSAESIKLNCTTADRDDWPEIKNTIVVLEVDPDMKKVAATFTGVDCARSPGALVPKSGFCAGVQEFKDEASTSHGVDLGPSEDYVTISENYFKFGVHFAHWPDLPAWEYAVDRSTGILTTARQEHVLVMNCVPRTKKF